VEALNIGAVSSPMVKGKAARVIDRDYEDVHFSIAGCTKTSPTPCAPRRAGRACAAGRRRREVYQMALQLGLGDLDIAAVSEVIRERQP